MTGPLGRATAQIKIHASGIHAAMVGAGMAVTRRAGTAAKSGQALASACAKSTGLLAGLGAAGVAVGGALGLVFGGAVAGIAALGISAAKAAPQVEAAFSDLGESVKSEMADAASVLQGPLVSAAGQLKGIFGSQIAPALTGMFEQIAPLITQFTGGLGQMLTPLLPAIQGIVAAVAPMMSTLAGSLGQFGGQLAGFLAPLSEAFSQNSGLLA